jgi:hypothetical protein
MTPKGSIGYTSHTKKGEKDKWETAHGWLLKGIGGKK